MSTLILITVIVIILIIKTHHDVNIFVKIFARCSKSFRGCIFKVPKFVFHAAVELLRIFFSFHVKLDTDGCILEGQVEKRVVRGLRN